MHIYYVRIYCFVLSYKEKGGGIVAYTEQQGQYSMEYAKKKLKRIPLDVKKEYYDEVILKAAEENGMSVRAFILSAIEEKINKNS